MTLPWDLYGEPASDELPYVPPAPPPPSPPVTAPAPTPEPVPDLPHQPAPVPPTPEPPDLVKADAKSRSQRTLIQGLIFDVFAAIIASIALLAGADPFVKETWIGFGVLLIKSVVSAAISYFMRLKSTPTIRTKGTKLAIMPVPRPMLDNERKSA